MKLDGTGNENHEKLPKNAKEEDHAEYIPIKKRRMLEAQKILLRKGKGSLLQDAEMWRIYIGLLILSYIFCKLC